ncbi:MAG TPA: STAS domain-containing protein [Burkholderiaceae bacterium]|nr:STAS domain-containing protein [Burkholderiaceae bacterium]
MGIFSHFRKKDRQASVVEEQVSSDGERAGSRHHTVFDDTLDSLSDPSTIQRDIARATALKIDAIESEMTLEFVNTTQIGNSGAPVGGDSPRAGANEKAGLGAATLPGFEATLSFTQEPTKPTAESAPKLVTAVDSADSMAELPSAPALEEAAILFASNQTAVAQQILQEAIQDDTLGPAAALAWSMLFDLHQVMGQREQFDALSIAYAGKFEMSPPTWRDAPALAPSYRAASDQPAAAPSVAFSGVLNAQSVKQLARAQKLAENHAQLRLEFSRVSAVDPVGCGLLLRVLKRLQKAGLELVLVGAPELANKIRAILAVGRRDETEVPWLLLLELLQLLNREKEFEEASIDYCVTFEVSPPAFAAPKTRISTAQDEAPAEAGATGIFLMPQVIEGDTEQLLSAIASYAEQHQPAILDCQQLARIDFSTAGPLLSGLSAQPGKTIELHNLNHLVIALLQALGLQGIVRIIPRKN